MQNLVEMQTTKNKDDLYKGSFVKNLMYITLIMVIHLHRTKLLKVADGTLNVYF